MDSKPVWTRVDVQFIFGLILALVIWGLQLIGVTVNLWLGAAVLAGAFVLMTRAFWVWEGPSRWQVAFRVLTVFLAAIVYCWPLWIQIKKEWKLEHPTMTATHLHEPPLPPPSTNEEPKQSAKPIKPKPKMPTQSAPDNSVHVDKGSKIEQQSSGDCSPNMIGGSNTITCGDIPPHITVTKLDSTVPDVSRFKVDVETKRPILLHIKATGSDFIDSLGIDDVRPPGQGGKAFFGSSMKGPNYYEEDFRDIESGSYIGLVRATQTADINLECR
jgi:hypothetical protein